MDLTKRFRINSPKVVHDSIDNEVIIIEFDSGNYYSLNQSGSDIWMLIHEESSIKEIFDNLSAKYQTNSHSIEEKLWPFLKELKNENLIIEIENKDQKTSKKLSIKQNNNKKTDKSDFEIPILQKYSDMQDLLLLDPIHEVDEKGWPIAKQNKS